MHHIEFIYMLFSTVRGTVSKLLKTAMAPGALLGASFKSRYKASGESLNSFEVYAVRLVRNDVVRKPKHRSDNIFWIVFYNSAVD